MAPLLSRVGFSRGYGSRKKGRGIVPVRFYIEIFAGKGGDNTTSPTPLSPSSPQRLGGYGGYTKLEMIVPTAYNLELFSPQTVWSGGSGSLNSGSGAPSNGFSIDNQWMAIVGGGGGAGNYFTNYPQNSPPIQPFASYPGGAGSGGSGGSGTGSVGTNGSFYDNIIVAEWGYYARYSSGGGGGGAPGGPSPTATNGNSGAGGGGGGVIRIRNETPGTSGYLPSNPEIYMNLVTSSNGTSTSARIIVTNFDTNGTRTYTSATTVPMNDVGEF